MKKLTIVFIELMAFSSSAYADYRNNRTQHYQHHNRSSGRWVAPLVGGMILGGIGSYYYYNRPIRCWDQPIVDRWNRLVGYDRYCD